MKRAVLLRLISAQAGAADRPRKRRPGRRAERATLCNPEAGYTIAGHRGQGAVSGVTYTSNGYLSSLQSALDKAGL